jgi:hypothetical protein
MLSNGLAHRYVGTLAEERHDGVDVTYPEMTFDGGGRRMRSQACSPSPVELIRIMKITDE